MLKDLAAGLKHDTNEPQLIPFGFGYALEGQPKMNLNANLSAMGANNIINHIQTNMPLFVSTNRSGAMSDTTYINYLAANIVDYADADFVPTLVGGEAGNEPQPWLNEIWDVTTWQDEPGSPALVKNVVGGVTNYIANITIRTFAEFWNMTDKQFICNPGDLIFTQWQTNRIARGSFYNTNQLRTVTSVSWSYTNATNITFNPNDYVVLMVSSNRIPLDFGTNEIPNYGVRIPRSTSTNAGVITTNSEYGYINMQFDGSGHATYNQSWKNITVDRITNASWGLAKSIRSVRRELPVGQQFGWVGNAMAQPVDLEWGLYGDPRISRHLRSYRIQANVYTAANSWGGRNYNSHTNSSGPNVNEIKNWSDGSYVTNSPRGVAVTSESDLPTNHLSDYYSNAPVRFNNSGIYSNATELGNIFDPIMWVLNGTNGPAHVTSNTPAAVAFRPLGGGGQSLRIGRAEHPRFALTANSTPQFTNGLRASQLLDIFEVGPGSSSGVSNVPAGRININTASTNVLRALAAGVFHSMDPALAPSGTNFVVPTNAVNAFISGVTNYRARQPFLAPSQLTLLATNTNLSQWPTNAVFGSKTLSGVTEWSDAASEEWFSKIYPLSTVRSRNFLVYVVGQSITTNSPVRVESGATNVFQIYMEPMRNSNGMTTNNRPVIIRGWSL
jgi:hypothetical protein